jgi:hypothetical protein
MRLALCSISFLGREGLWSEDDGSIYTHFGFRLASEGRCVACYLTIFGSRGVVLTVSCAVVRVHDCEASRLIAVGSNSLRAIFRDRCHQLTPTSCSHVKSLPSTGF